MLGMAVEAEQFLHPDRELRPLLGLVVDRHRRAGRRGEMGRRLGVEPALEVPRQQRARAPCPIRPAQTSASAVLTAAAARASRRRSRRAPRRTDPAIRRLRRGAGTSRGRAIAAATCVHGSRSMPSRAMPSASMSRGLVGRLRPASAARPARSRRAARCAGRAGWPRPDRTRSPRGVSIRSAKRASISSSVIGAASRMRPCAARAGQFGDRQERLARQRRRRIDIGAAAVGEQERAAGAAVLGDAVGIGEREDGADAELVSCPRDGLHLPRLRGRSGRGRS